MKPDWRDAPEWANWLAQDMDGVWHWYSQQPRFDGEEWLPPIGSKSTRHEVSPEDASENLEPRPAVQSPGVDTLDHCTAECLGVEGARGYHKGCTIDAIRADDYATAKWHLEAAEKLEE